MRLQNGRMKRKEDDNTKLKIKEKCLNLTEDPTRRAGPESQCPNHYTTDHTCIQLIMLHFFPLNPP